MDDPIIYAKNILESLNLPVEDLIEEVIETYRNYRKTNTKFVSHYDSEDIMKCVVLSVARKNGYYVMINELLRREEGFKDIYFIANKNKNIRSIYKNLKSYLGNPNYMNYNTESYVNRIGQLLDLQQKDLEVILNNISNNENILGVLAKFNKYLDINFSELAKIRPNLSIKYLKDNYL